jgi:hypothetical protein
MAGLRQPAVLLPLAELLLPFHPYRTVFYAGEAVDAAFRIGTLLDCRRKSKMQRPRNGLARALGLGTTAGTTTPSDNVTICLRLPPHPLRR